ncbi:MULTISPECIES: hypothetical protein [Henriciella]|uniref:hypothetical protein n=1 Tax=Henriciella TaxID=453849 RepID=UPI00351571CF
MRVPVRHWRVLFHNLGRLHVTFETARAEGRSWITWHLRDDGVIWISAWEETEAEKRAKCALPDGFNRMPWTRMEHGFELALLAHPGEGLARRSALFSSLILPAATSLALKGGASGLAHLSLLALQPP